jgi:hypothetical protein
LDELFPSRGFRKQPAIVSWYNTVRKFYYAPYVTNPELVGKMLEYIFSLENIVESEQKENARLFGLYMKRQFFSDGLVGVKCFNHFGSILNGYHDTTNNVNESLNHVLNSQIPYGNQTIGSIARIMHNRKFNALGRLVECMQDPECMNPRKPELIAKWTLLSANVQRFSELTQEDQCIQLIRLIYLTLCYMKIWYTKLDVLGISDFLYQIGRFNLEFPT